MDLGLKSKVAVVTGGSVGIGLAIAEGLAAEGVDLVIAARGADRVGDEARRIAEKSGVQHAMEAAGHTSSNYIWRYVKPSDEEKEKVLEDLF